MEQANPIRIKLNTEGKIYDGPVEVVIQGRLGRSKADGLKWLQGRIAQCRKIINTTRDPHAIRRYMGSEETWKRVGTRLRKQPVAALRKQPLDLDHEYNRISAEVAVEERTLGLEEEVELEEVSAG